MSLFQEEVVQKKKRAEIYVTKGSFHPSEDATTRIHIKNLLQLKGILENEIQETELEHSSFLPFPSNNEKMEFPFVTVCDVPVGNVKQFEDWIINGNIDAILQCEQGKQVQHGPLSEVFEERLQDVLEHKNQLLEEMEKAKEQDKEETVSELQASILQLDQGINTLHTLLQNQKSQSLSVGLVDKAVETGKVLVENLTTAFSSVSSYFWGNSTSQEPPPFEDQVGTYLEFEVVKTNWFWREQIRLLRFFNHYFRRIHPETGEVRQEYKYTQIEKILMRSKTFITIYFKHFPQPEYYQSVQAERILEVIVDRAAPYTFPIQRS